MLIDDNKLNLKVASKLLVNYKCETIETMSGEEGITKINNGEKFDLLLVDEMMPGMTGTEMMKALRDKGYTVPMVVLTADVDVNAREKYMAKGFDDYLGKPFDKQELENILKKFL